MKYNYNNVKLNLNPKSNTKSNQKFFRLKIMHLYNEKLSYIYIVIKNYRLENKNYK